jgi:hypothetical protein
MANARDRLIKDAKAVPHRLVVVIYLATVAIAMLGWLWLTFDVFQWAFDFKL